MLHEKKRRVVLAPDDAKARIELAEALRIDGQLDAAVEQLDRALAIDPDLLDARLGLARIYLAQERVVLAERTLQETLRRDPTAASARDELAAIYLRIDRPDDALLQLQLAIDGDPEDLGRRLRAAELAERRGLLPKALEHLDAILAKAPDDAAARRLRREIARDLGELTGEVESPLDRGPEFLLGRLRATFDAPALSTIARGGPLAEAARHARQGDLPSAKRALVTAQESDRALADLLRGEIALVTAEHAIAEKAFQRAAHDPRPAIAIAAWRRLGELAAHGGRSADAIAASRAILAISKDDVDALIALGDAHVARGEETEAEEAYRRAVAIEPGGGAAPRLHALRSRARRPSRGASRSTSLRGQLPGQLPGQLGALGWNGHGGRVSPIEAVAIPGKGELLFTGNVGKVGQEAARVAWSCVRARAKDLRLEQAVERHDLHLHYVDTEISKDGPSAGLALTLAAISALRGELLLPDLAATGEITLHGGVRPVGGLHEKLVAAMLAGVRVVIAPRKNLLDLRELADEVRRGIALHPVTTLDEALEVAFVAGSR